MTYLKKRLFPPAINKIITQDSLMVRGQLPLYIATRNEDKLKEYSRILKKEVAGTDLKVPEIQSEDPFTVLAEKAKSAWMANNGKPIIVEDTSLICSGIEGLPGPFVDQYTNTLHKREALCRMLDGHTRAAVFQVGIAIFDGNELHYRIGKVTGKIAEKPIGTEGFGFDDIFIPDGQLNSARQTQSKPAAKTYAQMTPLEKDKFSARRKALELLLGKPFVLNKNIYKLPEPYPIQIQKIRKDRLSANDKAVQFAYALEQFKDNTPDADFSAKERKPYLELNYADGQIKQYITDSKSASIGLLITPWDTSTDLYGKPKRIFVNEFNEPVFWQIGDEATKIALASRAYEFSLNHNEKMYTYIRDMVKGKIELTPRPKKRSMVIEEMLKIHRVISDDTTRREEADVRGTVATRELGYARMSSDEYMSRTVSANTGLLLNSAGFPSSLFALGGMPPVTGWRDVIVTAALSYMRSYIPRNSVFAGNLDRQLRLFDQAVKVIESLKLPPDIKKIVIKQIGISVGVENPKAIAEIAEKIMDKGCSSIRIYTTNPDPRVIETARAIRKVAGHEMTICVGPIVDINQARLLAQPDIAVNILLAGHGGGENCTSLAGGGTANALELLYEMYSDPLFDNTAIGLEGGTGDEIGALIGMLDVISLNRRGVAGGIETGGLFVEHINGKAVQPYHGSASNVTQWIEAAMQPEIAQKRLNDAGRLRNIEGVLNYMAKKLSTYSIVDCFWERRMFAGRALADQGAHNLYELRRKINQRGHINHRMVTNDAAFIAAAHRRLEP